jgi:hypothetical protein
MREKLVTQMINSRNLRQSSFLTKTTSGFPADSNAQKLIAQGFLRRFSDY